MIEELINKAKQQLSGDLKQKENLNDEQVNQAFGATKDSLLDAVGKQASEGGLGQITSLFNGNKENSGSLINSAVGSLIPKLVSRLNISQEKASSIAGMIVPFIVNKFSSKETGTARDEKDLMQKLNLGSPSGIAGSLKGLFG